MAQYPYDQLGTPLDTANLEKVNGNWSKIEADIKSVDSASQQRDNLITSDYTAQLHAQKSEYTSRLNNQYADYIGRFSAQQTEYREGFQTQKVRIDNIVSEISDEAFNQVLSSATVNRSFNPVANFTSLSTTYPNAQNGDAVQTLDDNKTYRFDGSQWVYIEQFGSGPFTSVFNRLDEQKYFVSVLEYGAVGDGVSDDTTPIQNAIAATPNGGTLVFDPGKTYKITATLNITTGMHIEGLGVVFKAGIAGLDKVFSADGAISNLHIRNIVFDQDLKGRTVINFKNISDFSVTGCKFSHYTADYGTSTTESAIRLTACRRGEISKNTFYQFGNQYDETTATLNRAITIQNDGVLGESESIIVRGNHFKDVNQGIVVNSGVQHIISNNVFDGQTDNSIYAFGNGLVITGNSFRNRSDETLVISGKNYVITGNTFFDVKNKLVAFNGATESVVFADNTIDNNVTSTVSIANLFATRSSYTVTDLSIENNVFKVATNPNNFPYFDFSGVVDNISVIRNTFRLANSNGQKIFNFTGPSVNGVFSRNTVVCTTATALFLDTGTGTDASGLTVEQTSLTNARYFVAKSNLSSGQRIQVNAGPYATGRPIVRSLYATEIPTIGTWGRGDTLWNETPSIGSPLGWVCVAGGTPGTWLEMPMVQGVFSNVTLSNGWIAGTTAPAYRKNNDGTVSLRGQMSGGAPSGTSTAFTLPSGFRPSTRIVFAATGSAPNSGTTTAVSMVRIIVNTSGSVVVETGDGSFVSLDGLRFSTTN